MHRFANLSVFYILLIVCNLVSAQTFPVLTTGDSGNTYFTFNIDQDVLQGAPDRSSLNQPLTAADRLFVRDGHFFKVGADLQPGTNDDQRVRLYGINLTFSTNFPSPEEAIKLAKRFRKLGFNAVRLHHMDTNPSDATNPPKSALLPGPYPTFNPVALKRLHNFIRVLANEGIYTNINLYVNYAFSHTIDNIPAFDNDNDKKAYGTAVHIYAEKLVERQEQYAKTLLQALELKAFNGLAMVEISNEASLLAAWQNGKWRATTPANYAPELQRMWHTWLISKYGAIDAACKAWGECTRINNSIPLLSPNDISPVSIVEQWKSRVTTAIDTVLPSTSNTMDPAPLKDNAFYKRQYDFLQFLADTDRNYFNRFRTLIHRETDKLVPVTGTQMMYGGVMNFDSHAEMDYIDEHHYLDHPQHPGQSWDYYDWRMRDSTLNEETLRRLLAISYRRDSKKPFVVSEYNMPFPNRQSALIQPVTALIAAMQDWDGLFFYDYADGHTWENAPSSFGLIGEWGKFSLTGQSALLFRQHLQPVLPQAITIPLSKEARLGIESSKDYYNSFNKHLLARYAISPEQALQQRIAMDLTGKTIAPKGNGVQTLPWHAADQTVTFDTSGLLRLNTSQAKGLFGVLPKQPTELMPGMVVTYTDTGRRFVSLLLTALDGKPVPQSDRLLLTITGSTTSTQPGSKPLRPKEIISYQGQKDWWTFEQDGFSSNKPSGSRKGIAPVWMERTQVSMTLPSTMANMIIYPLDGAGQRLPALDTTSSKSDSQTRIHLQSTASQTTLWYEIVRNKP